MQSSAHWIKSVSFLLKADKQQIEIRMCGTLEYMSPEVGLFNLLLGDCPFK